VAGRRPAGTELGPPEAVSMVYTASPVDWPGKKTSTMADTRGSNLAHVISSGPALNNRRMTGTPIPARIYMKQRDVTMN